MSKLSVILACAVLCTGVLLAKDHRDQGLLAVARASVVSANAAAKAAEDHDEDLSDAAFELVKQYAKMKAEADRCRM